MHQIYIANRKRKKDSLEKEFRGAVFIDVTSQSGSDVFRTLSPMYPHGGIPVAFTGRTMTAMSVESIWQGLKVFENEAADFSWFQKTSVKGLKRVEKIHGRGAILGHQQGIHQDRPLLSLIEARRLIFTPTYKWVLKNKASQAIGMIQTTLEKNDVVLLESGYERDIRDIFTPLPHASLIKLFLLGQYPNIDHPWVPYTQEDHDRDIEKRKAEKKNRLNPI